MVNPRPLTHIVEGTFGIAPRNTSGRIYLRSVMDRAIEQMGFGSCTVRGGNWQSYQHGEAFDSRIIRAGEHRCWLGPRSAWRAR